MTISTQDSKVNYQGNGQTKVFQIPFPFLENEQIYVQKKDVEGNLINYTYATDYTVTGAGEENGGSVTLNVAPEQGSTISIYRDVPLTQEVDYRENEIFPAETHEEALDKLTMEVQQLQEQLDRSIKVDRFSDVDLDIFVNEIERVYDSTDNIDIVANNINDVNTVADNIANVNTTATNIVAIQYAPTAATNAANSATASATSAQAAQDALNDVQGLIATPIGTIFQSIYVDESLDIARQLNGQLISSTKFTGFRSWLNTVQTATPNLFTTETNWQAEKTNSKLGQCGKFVVDDTAGTIRLPCVVNAQGLVDLALIGGIKAESLPNISGGFGLRAGADSYEWSGAFDYSRGAETQNVGGGSSQASSVIYNFNASRSSSTYQDNAPVQQEAIQYPYYIQVATGVEETLPAIREYQINTPFFFGQSMYSDVAPDNASWLVSNGQWNAKSVYPDYYDWLLEQMNAGVSGFVASTATYTDYDFVINTADQTFRLPILNGEESVINWDKFDTLTVSESGQLYTAPANGCYVFVVSLADSTYFAIFKGNNVHVSELLTNENAAIAQNYVAKTSVKQGDTIRIQYAGTPTVQSVRFYYAQGNGSLYYYVGDTVQDASLINAGAVLGQLSNKADASQFQVVSALPAAPNANVFYFIPE